MISKHIESALCDVLQRDISIVCNNKTIKQGRLINFTINDYVMSFTLRNNKDQLKNYDMYYPYDMEQSDNEILLDYTADTLSSQNERLLDLLHSIKPEKTHKHYDSIVYIKYD